MNKNRKISLIIMFFLSVVAFAQQSIEIPDDVNYFITGKECYSNGQYDAAVYNFEHYVANSKTEHDYAARLVEAQYYIVCANYYQQKSGVESQMIQFVEDNKGTYYANDIAFKLAHYYYAKEDYKRAVKAFDQCDESLLDEEDLAEYYYPLGYTNFALQHYQEAKPLFKKSIDKADKYYDESLYYYSFLQYKDENYNTALTGFEELNSKGLYRETVPYYIAQIYFSKEEYDKLIALAPKLLKNESDNNDELNRMLGDAYYRKGDYDKAIVYLEAYQDGAKKTLRQDLYHLGIAYYMKKDYAKASETLAQITAQNDALSQNAYAYLGECFVRMDDKERACLAFETASKYKFDNELREDAYYNYVKLSYETARSPFNGTIALLEGFLDEFPNSDYKVEIYDLMYKSYMTTTNYKDACASIERLNSKESRLVMARQRVMYYRGVELYNLGEYQNAIVYFKKSLEGDPREKKLKARAMFWMGDAYYQLAQYNEAQEQLRNFIATQGAYGVDEFAIAHYNLGYCFFKRQHYNEAISWFRKYTQLKKATDNDWLTDAYNRTGDCFFLKRDFYNAIKYYSSAIERGGDGIDYAYYQKGFCQGMSHQYDPKIVTLKKLLKDYPESAYADDALFEEGRTWVMLQRYDEAIEAYKQMPYSYPNSKYASKSLLNAGLAYYNKGELDNASVTYKQVVDDYPGTEDARSAMLALKNISIEQNSVHDYIAYAKEKGAADMEVQEQDSLNFLAAEKLYIGGKYEQAISAFEAYSKQFPKGVYILESYFYMADAYMQTGNSARAMTCLEYIVKQPRSIYTEQALSVLSATYYNEKQYAKALESYKSLLDNAEKKENILAAKIGIMECNYLLGEAGATIMAVDNLLNESLPFAMLNKAYYYKAKSFIVLNNKSAAKEAFAVLAKDVNNKYGAEAKYQIAQMLYDDDKLDESKAEVLDFINKGTSEQYWLAKAFILLSDIYVTENDLFQAKQYLLSISDNYKQDDDILKIVEARLENIEAKEEAQNISKRDSLGAHFSNPNDSIN